MNINQITRIRLDNTAIIELDYILGDNNATKVVTLDPIKYKDFLANIGGTIPRSLIPKLIYLIEFHAYVTHYSVDSSEYIEPLDDKDDIDEFLELFDIDELNHIPKSELKELIEYFNDKYPYSDDGFRYILKSITVRWYGTIATEYKIEITNTNQLK